MIVLDNGQEAGAWMTTTNKTYDLAFTADHYGARGRFHHLTYALDSRDEVLRAADIFLENGVYIETGPHKHAVSRPSFCTCTSPAVTASRWTAPARG
jgi:catechol 2,3-dioxygenase